MIPSKRLRDSSAKILSQFERRSKQGSLHFANLASICGGLEGNNQAIAWLEKAYDQRFDPEVLRRTRKQVGDNPQPPRN